MPVSLYQYSIRGNGAWGRGGGEVGARWRLGWEVVRVSGGDVGVLGVR